MNLPNILTLSRFGMAAVVFWLIATTEYDGMLLALGIFIVACFTDFFDGWLARRNQQETAFGRIADPFADKFLVVGCLIFLLARNANDRYDCGLTATVIFVILAREFLVNGLRAYAESRGIRFGAEWSGKFKVVWQYFAIGWVMLYMARGGTFDDNGVWTPGMEFYPWAMKGIVWSTVLVTLWSLVPYLSKARTSFK